MNWSASDKLKKQILVELEQLSRLFEDNLDLISKANDVVPSKVEILALAAFLHSFYTGIENIFGRIYTEMHGKKLSGEAWHKNLLQTMARQTELTPPILSLELCEKLSGYLSFRHVFRQAYTFDIRWDKMNPLVLNCKAVFEQFLNEFLNGFNLKLKP